MGHLERLNTFLTVKKTNARKFNLSKYLLLDHCYEYSSFIVARDESLANYIDYKLFSTVPTSIQQTGPFY